MCCVEFPGTSGGDAESEEKDGERRDGVEIYCYPFWSWRGRRGCSASGESGDFLCRVVEHYERDGVEIYHYCDDDCVMLVEPGFI